MSARQLLDFYGDFYSDFRRDAAEEMLEHLQIQPKQRIKQMSKGTREKVQLIMVMSREAKLYLLISTHLIADVEKVLDDIIFINRGQVALQSSVDQVREERGMSVDALFREVFKC